MLNVPGLRAVLVHQPWRDDYDLYMGGHGADGYIARRVKGGQIIYERPADPAVEPHPFLHLSRSEVEALAKALLAEARPEDATLDALKDARATRDRLLAMFETRGIR